MEALSNQLAQIGRKSSGEEKKSNVFLDAEFKQEDGNETNTASPVLVEDFLV